MTQLPGRGPPVARPRGAASRRAREARSALRCGRRAPGLPKRAAAAPCPRRVQRRVVAIGHRCSLDAVPLPEVGGDRSCRCDDGVGAADDAPFEGGVQSALGAGREGLAQQLEQPAVAEIGEPGRTAGPERQRREVRRVGRPRGDDAVNVAAARDEPPNGEGGCRRPVHEVRIGNEHLRRRTPDASRSTAAPVPAAGNGPRPSAARRRRADFRSRARTTGARIIPEATRTRRSRRT